MDRLAHARVFSREGAGPSELSCTKRVNWGGNDRVDGEQQFAVYLKGSSLGSDDAGDTRFEDRRARVAGQVGSRKRAAQAEFVIGL